MVPISKQGENIMKTRSYAYFLLINIALACSFIAAEDFIFDLGGVLIDTNKRASVSHMGMVNIAQYGFHLKMNPLRLGEHIKTRFFVILDSAAILNNLEESSPLNIAYDENGRVLPYLMRAWLQGTMKCHTIKALITREIIAHPEWFTHDAEQRIIVNLMHMIFTPKQFVATRTVSTAGISFIKKCKRLGHGVYALSNWDSESFELLKQKYPELFTLFDGIVISGDTNTLKPTSSIFQTLLARYCLIAEHCWFIDDQKENVLAAQKLGINGIVHTTSFAQLTEKIRHAHQSKSLAPRANLTKIGISVSSTKKTNSPIIEGENISLADSTIYNCLPAKA